MSGATFKHDASIAPREGFIVVAVLWLLAGLAALAVIASVYLAQSAVTLTALDPATQQDMLATAGIELAAYELAVPTATDRPTRGAFSFMLAGSTIRVAYVSEAARVNINMASRAMLAGLFASLGAEGDAADQYAERVVAWRSPPKPNSQDDEAELYRAAELSYPPRHSPFNSVDELWMVLGLPESLVRRAMPYVTVYSGTADIDVLDAAPVALAALPGISAGRLDSFLSERDALTRNDTQAVMDALGGQQPGATVSGGDTYRIRLRIIPPAGTPTVVEAVIKIFGPEDKWAYRILAWRNEADEGGRGR